MIKPPMINKIKPVTLPASLFPFAPLPPINSALNFNNKAPLPAIPLRAPDALRGATTNCTAPRKTRPHFIARHSALCLAPITALRPTPPPVPATRNLPPSFPARSEIPAPFPAPSNAPLPGTLPRGSSPPCTAPRKLPQSFPDRSDIPAPFPAPSNAPLPGTLPPGASHPFPVPHAPTAPRDPTAAPTRAAAAYYRRKASLFDNETNREAVRELCMQLTDTREMQAGLDALANLARKRPAAVKQHASMVGLPS